MTSEQDSVLAPCGPVCCIVQLSGGSRSPQNRFAWDPKLSCVLHLATQRGVPVPPEQLCLGPQVDLCAATCKPAGGPRPLRTGLLGTPSCPVWQPAPGWGRLTACECQP